METIKHLINQATDPALMTTIIFVVFFFIFPPNAWFSRWNERLGLKKLWTNEGGLAVAAVMVIFFAFGMSDENFRLIVLKPDNVPIVGLLFLTYFFLWLSMKQALTNDKRLANKQKPEEYSDPKDKVLVWPDLVYIELICLILCTVLLIGWSVGLHAPLEEPANPTISPNPSKAPWYFLGLQEMLVYFDPWLAGVVFPTLILVGLMAIPYIDNNKKGSGYYCYEDRKMAMSIFLFGWLALWVFMILIGTFLRGPNWNFFGPFEYWDAHKLEPLTNVNLSEIIYVKFLGMGLPSSILAREMWGFIIIGAYFIALPPLLAKTVFKKIYQELGTLRFSVYVMLALSLVSLPIKMYLRWLMNLKYIIAIPEYFFNI